MIDLPWMTRLDFMFPQIASGDLDIPIIGQLPAANLALRAWFTQPMLENIELGRHIVPDIISTRS
jgi:hypothetical protein